MSKFTGLYVLDADAFGMIYPPDVRDAIAEYVEIGAGPQNRSTIVNNRRLLRGVNVIFSGWGAPVFDEELLDAAPELEAIFYGAGSVGYCMTPVVWERGIVVTSAIAANAVPVAEYTLANIIFSLKRGWDLTRTTRQQRRFPDRDGAAGCYGSTVGLISLGTIARTLLKMLAMFELRVKVYDPFLKEAEARSLGVEQVSLEEIFRTSDVVSLHTPVFPETRGMITGEHFNSMKQGATFINTARAEVVRQDEMLDVAKCRPDLQFVLDVTDPEPPEADSPLFYLDNIVLTPHIAGSVGRECARMGQYIVEELRRYVSGQPLLGAVTPESAENSTHRPVQRRTVEVAISKLGAVSSPVEIPLD